MPRHTRFDPLLYFSRERFDVNVLTTFLVHDVSSMKNEKKSQTPSSRRNNRVDSPRDFCRLCVILYTYHSSIIDLRVLQ